MHLRIVYILLASVVFFSCQKNTVDPVPPVITAPIGIAASTTLNVAYGADVAQKMDVYLPANRSTSTTKVLIVIHGGGWVSGDKTDMDVFVNALKTRLPDYAIFNINYRLAALPNINPFPTQENDTKAAIDFINTNRVTYNISEKYALLGASAGGHLALLQAYKNATPKIKAVIDLYGPTDLVDMYNNPASSAVPAGAIGFIVSGSPFGTPTTSPAIFSSSSPLNFITATSPPTIIFHGNLDTLVRPSQSVALVTKLTQFAVVKQYYNYATEGHAYLTPGPLGDTFDKAIAFLNQYVQ
jgi:acetyl esterase/lipase